MKKVFMIHGFEGSPNGGWRPWLMGELEKQDVYACALSMPAPENPVVSEWVAEISRHVERNAGDDIYLVGHSLGVPAILRYLESHQARNIKGAVLVSGPVNKTKRSRLSEFLEAPFDFTTIRKKAEHFVVIHGEDDLVVPADEAEILSKSLHAPLVLVQNGGHLNGTSGWTKLPQALEALNEMMAV